MNNGEVSYKKKTNFQKESFRDRTKWIHTEIIATNFHWDCNNPVNLNLKNGKVNQQSHEQNKNEKRKKK